MDLKNVDKYIVNIYRTKHYIVEQYLKFYYLPDGTFTLYSDDYYYLKTKRNDKDFERLRSGEENVNGKRIYAGVYTRKYAYK